MGEGARKARNVTGKGERDKTTSIGLLLQHVAFIHILNIFIDFIYFHLSVNWFLPTLHFENVIIIKFFTTVYGGTSTHHKQKKPTTLSTFK